MIGWRNGPRLHNSIVTSQRPAPATLAMAEPWLRPRDMKNYFSHQEIAIDGKDPICAQESQSRDVFTLPTVSDAISSPGKELALLLGTLKDAKKSDLWTYLESFLQPYTKAKLTDDAEVAEIRALIQILSYPRTTSLTKDWVTTIQNYRKRRMLTVITLLVRAVSDSSLVCDTCTKRGNRAKHCSFLQNIKPEHQALKHLVGGKCCYCILLAIECQKPAKVTNNSPQTASREDIENVPPTIRHKCSDELRHILTHAIYTNKVILPSGIFDVAKYAQQRAELIELKLFDSRTDSQDYITRMENCCNELSGPGAEDLLVEVLHKSLSSPSLDAMITSKLSNISSRQQVNSSEIHDHRFSWPLLESRQQPRLPSEQPSARLPSDPMSPSSPSLFVSPLNPGPGLRDGDADLAGNGISETFGSIMHRAVMLGIDVKKLEQSERSKMTQWVTTVLSFPRLDVTQRILKLAATVEKAPLEMRKELRQDYIGALQAGLPSVAPAEWMAAVLSIPAVSSRLEQNVSDLVTAMRRLPAQDQAGLGRRVLGAFTASL